MPPRQPASQPAAAEPSSGHEEGHETILAEHKRARLAAETAAERASRLLTITAALSRALTPERVAELVLEGGMAVTGAQAGHVALIDALGEELRLLASAGRSEIAAEGWERIPLSLDAPVVDAVKRGELIVVANRAELVERYPAVAAMATPEAANAWVCLPLSLDINVIGAIGLSYGGPVTIGEDERTFLMILGGLCAQALERARLMVSEREALAAADEALAMVDTVIDSAPIGLAVMDRDFRYLRINRRLAELNGRPPAEHIGRLASELYPRAFKLWEPHWRQVIATGEPVTDVEVDGRELTGQELYLLVSYFPVRVGAGAVVGLGVVVVDITGRRRAEQERVALLSSAQAARATAQEAQARAEAALQIRETFLSVVAHELKTPLTSLLGQAQLLERRLAQAGLLTEPNERSLHVVVGQARRLSHLIGDLLDGAHLETGQLALDLRPLDLGKLVAQVIDEAQPMTLGHTLVSTIEPDGLIVQGDVVRLEQVVQNLIGNAVKYSPRGTTIRVRASRDEGFARLSVADEGIGIPSEELPRLFERFYRVERPETRSVSGVGVGLFVVRELVRLHGGTVEVQSTVGAGSTFTVSLPLVEPA